MWNPDFRDLLAALNASGARYLVVGGYAFARLAKPRTTKDLDVWVEATPANAARVFSALLAFGAPGNLFAEEDLARPGAVLQVGVEPNRVDIRTEIDGVTFAEAWEGRETDRFDDLEVPFIGREALIRNKRATGRKQDEADLEWLVATPPGNGS